MTADYRSRLALRAAIVAVAVSLVVSGTLVYVVLALKGNQEDICHTVNASYAGKLKDYKRTVAFLKSPESRKPGLRVFRPLIVQQLPQDKLELVRAYKLIPAGCRSVDPKPERPPK